MQFKTFDMFKKKEPAESLLQTKIFSTLFLSDPMSECFEILNYKFYETKKSKFKYQSFHHTVAEI